MSEPHEANRAWSKETGTVFFVISFVCGLMGAAIFFTRASSSETGFDQICNTILSVGLINASLIAACGSVLMTIRDLLSRK